MTGPGRLTSPAACLAHAVMACDDGTIAEGRELVALTVVSWRGAYQTAMTDAWFDPCVEEHAHVTLLEPIDCAKVPCDELRPGRFRPTGDRVPVMVRGLAVAYRTDAWDGAEPAGWEDTWSDVTVARDDLRLGDNRDEIASRFDAWVAEHGG